MEKLFAKTEADLVPESQMFKLAGETAIFPTGLSIMGDEEDIIEKSASIDDEANEMHEINRQHQRWSEPLEGPASLRWDEQLTELEALAVL